MDLHAAAHVRPCENWCSLISTLFQTGSIFLTRGHLLSCKPILTSGKWVPLWWSQRNRFWCHILSCFSWWRILHILSRKISWLHLSRSLFWNCPIYFYIFFIFFGQIFQKCQRLICSEAWSRKSIPVELPSKNLLHRFRIQKLAVKFVLHHKIHLSVVKESMQRLFFLNLVITTTYYCQ